MPTRILHTSKRMIINKCCHRPCLISELKGYYFHCVLVPIKSFWEVICCIELDMFKNTNIPCEISLCTPMPQSKDLCHTCSKINYRALSVTDISCLLSWPLASVMRKITSRWNIWSAMLSVNYSPTIHLKYFSVHRHARNRSWVTVTVTVVMATCRLHNFLRNGQKIISKFLFPTWEIYKT